MKILGKDGIEYKTVDECIAADKAFDKRVAEQAAKEEAEKKAAEKKLAERKAEISKRKKELSNAIDNADVAVKEARVEYAKAKERAEKLIAEARSEAQKILNDASAVLKKATENKMTAISNFNKEFGPFTTVMTGEDAWNEYKRMSSAIDDMFNNFYFTFWNRH